MYLPCIWIFHQCIHKISPFFFPTFSFFFPFTGHRYLFVTCVIFSINIWKNRSRTIPLFSLYSLSKYQFRKESERNTPVMINSSTMNLRLTIYRLDIHFTYTWQNGRLLQYKYTSIFMYFCYPLFKIIIIRLHGRVQQFSDSFESINKFDIHFLLYSVK